MEKLMKLRITNYGLRIPTLFPFIIHPSSFIIAAVVGTLVCNAAFAQQPQSGAGVAVDSIHIVREYRDSLLKVDSLKHATMKRGEFEAEFRKQIASQREVDLTNDGKPEVLRINGYPAKNLDSTKLTFTIKSGKKKLFTDTWIVGGYFDTIDHLTDSTKLRRLRRIVTVAFANENFLVIDSSDLKDIFKRVDPDELKPDSPEIRELFTEPRVMYSVFHSRDYWYGLVWDPKKQKFVKLWRN
jgi:hypothetical protein